MPSKIVVDKQKSSRALSNFGKANAEGVSADLAKLIAEGIAVLDEKLLADALKALFLAPSERLVKFSGAMAQADDGYTREQGDDDEPRQRRDKFAALLSDGLIELREIVVGSFGSEQLRGLGFSQQTPQDPEQMVRFAQEIFKTFEARQKDGTFPAAKRGISVDLSAYLPDLVTYTNDLDAVLGKVSLEKRELQTALELKNNTLDAHDVALRRTANLFEGILRFLGRDELADKIRPSTRTPGQLEDPEQLEEPLNR